MVFLGIPENWNSIVELDGELVMTDCNLGISFSFSGFGFILIPIPISHLQTYRNDIIKSLGEKVCMGFWKDHKMQEKATNDSKGILCISKRDKFSHQSLWTTHYPKFT